MSLIFKKSKILLLNNNNFGNCKNVNVNFYTLSVTRHYYILHDYYKKSALLTTWVNFPSWIACDQWLRGDEGSMFGN